MGVTNMLKIQNLKKSYGKRTILNNVNMNIPKGKVYALIGPNGAGKSTIMKILTGLVSKTSGSIIFEGREWSRRDLRKIGSIIEEPPLYKNLSAYDNMKVVTTMLGVSESTILPLLNKVGLGNIDKRPVKQFSLGMKQRLGIAISLINSPKLLILDEPTNGLDPIGIQELREIIESFKSEGMTIMISSHILSEVEHLADFIGFIYEGKIVLEKEYDGSENLEELFNNQILFEKRR
ncbi:mutacin ABC transporter, ATP-binding protein MutF [Streptococcus pyogenes ATCC 10782]|nr:mutacin ABC transporter, ATP-binding protein MutF [Streptococcus pyogenes ATCC 10782]